MISVPLQYLIVASISCTLNYSKWKIHRRRFHELSRLGISVSMAFASIRCRKGPWR